MCRTIPIRAAPKEQPKTTDATANELLIGGRLSSSAFRMAPPSKSITGGVVTSQTRPRRKQQPEIIMDLGGHPCREVSDVLREAVAANQSKRAKEIAAKSWRGDGAPPALCK